MLLNFPSVSPICELSGKSLCDGCVSTRVLAPDLHAVLGRQGEQSLPERLGDLSRQRHDRLSRLEPPLQADRPLAHRLRVHHLLDVEHLLGVRVETDGERPRLADAVDRDRLERADDPRAAGEEHDPPARPVLDREAGLDEQVRHPRRGLPGRRQVHLALVAGLDVDGADHVLGDTELRGQLGVLHRGQAAAGAVEHGVAREGVSVLELPAAAAHLVVPEVGGGDPVRHFLLSERDERHAGEPAEHLEGGEAEDRRHALPDERDVRVAARRVAEPFEVRLHLLLEPLAEIEVEDRDRGVVDGEAGQHAEGLLGRHLIFLLPRLNWGILCAFQQSSEVLIPELLAILNCLVDARHRHRLNIFRY